MAELVIGSGDDERRMEITDFSWELEESDIDEDDIEFQTQRIEFGDSE